MKERIGETGHEYIEVILAAVQAGDKEKILTTVQAMEEMAVSLESFLRLMLGEIRTGLHESITSGKKDQAALFHQMLNVLLATVRDVRIAPVPGLVLESALLHLCDLMKQAPTKDRKSTRLNSSHIQKSRMPSSA